MRGATTALAAEYAEKRGFQSTHPMRGATFPSNRKVCPYRDFNPRTPCGVRRFPPQVGDFRALIAIHAPHAGCDMSSKRSFQVGDIFQSTHPMRGATASPVPRDLRTSHFNPRTPCGVRRHARLHRPHRSDISIHAPHAGCDEVILGPDEANYLFQSTHPMRGATRNISMEAFFHANFNPRTPCGVRLSMRISLCSISRNFNPRTPCGVRRTVSDRAH